MQHNKAEAQGTEVTKYNAIKHGILRETITPYEIQDYEALYDQLEVDIKPVNALETLLLERIVINKIKLDRINKAESGMLKKDSSIHRMILPSEEKFHSTGNSQITPYIPSDTFVRLEVYSRYETQAENRMYKSINMLQNLRNS
jgi:hypothetical protein